MPLGLFEILNIFCLQFWGNVWVLQFFFLGTCRKLMIFVYLCGIFTNFSAVDIRALWGAAGIKQTYGEGGEGLDRLIVLSNGWRGPCIFLKISRLVTAENSLPLRSGIKKVNLNPITPDIEKLAHVSLFYWVGRNQESGLWFTSWRLCWCHQILASSILSTRKRGSKFQKWTVHQI